MFTRELETVHQPGTLESFDKVVLSNCVMHGCTSLSTAAERRRSGIGISTSSGSPHTRNPTSQFACTLILPFGYNGMLMRYASSTIRVGRHTTAESFYIVNKFLRASGVHWISGSTVPNSVATVYFKRVVTPSLRSSVRAVKCGKFSGVRLIANHTLTVHLGRRKNGVQNQSTATVPGTRTATELYACLLQLEHITKPHYGVEWTPSLAEKPLRD